MPADFLGQKQGNRGDRRGANVVRQQQRCNSGRQRLGSTKLLSGAGRTSPQARKGRIYGRRRCRVARRCRVSESSPSLPFEAVQFFKRMVAGCVAIGRWREANRKTRGHGCEATRTGCGRPAECYGRCQGVLRGTLDAQRLERRAAPRSILLRLANERCGGIACTSQG